MIEIYDYNTKELCSFDTKERISTLQLLKNTLAEAYGFSPINEYWKSDLVCEDYCYFVDRANHRIRVSNSHLDNCFIIEKMS